MRHLAIIDIYMNKENNVVENIHSKITSYHPFINLIGLKITKCAEGCSRCEIEIFEDHFNPHKVVHGGVLFSMADTGMGMALYTILSAQQQCATIELKINFFKPVTFGILICETRVIHPGKNIAVLESEIYNEQTLIAKALGSFAILTNANNRPSTTAP